MGFAREPLLLVPYDSQWSVVFDLERDRLQAAMGSLAVRIDHHGSTSVPGPTATPFIDIQTSAWWLPTALSRFVTVARPPRSAGWSVAGSPTLMRPPRTTTASSAR